MLSSEPKTKMFFDRLVDHGTIEGLWFSNGLMYNEGGDIIGKFNLYHQSSHKVFITLIALYEEYRNRGYFHQVLDLISRVADINGDTIQLIPLPTETDEISESGITLGKLQSIYESYGFMSDIEEDGVSTYTRIPTCARN